MTTKEFWALILLICVASVCMALSGCSVMQTLAQRVKTINVGVGFTVVNPDGSEFTTTDNLSADFKK